MFADVTKFPPIKSLPSFGPIFPLSNPLKLLDGIYSRSDNLIFLFVIEFAVLIKNDALVILFSYNSVKNL